MASLPVKRILCPTDFSDYSTRSLRQAVALARWFGSEIRVLHVVPPILPAPVPSEKTRRGQAEEELAQFVASVLHEPVVVKTQVREGTPWREIEAEARALPADLIVMGTHGRSGFEHLVLGSVTEKLLRRAPCPVLTVCHGQKPSAKRQLFRRIVCAADLTDDSAHTISFALSMAEENEARVVLLHVLDGRLEAGSLRRDLEAFALERLRRAVPDEARDLCAVDERVAAGKPHGEIVRVAAEEGADLIVMGTHGKSGFDHLLLGFEVVVEAA